jgi:hypothetical protein
MVAMSRCMTIYNIGDIEKGFVSVSLYMGVSLKNPKSHGLNSPLVSLECNGSGQWSNCIKEGRMQTHKKCKKCIKHKFALVKLVLGDDVCMHQVVDMVSKL